MKNTIIYAVSAGLVLLFFSIHSYNSEENLEYTAIANACETIDTLVTKNIDSQLYIENDAEPIQNSINRTEKVDLTYNIDSNTNYKINNKCFEIIDYDLKYNISIEYPEIQGLNNAAIEKIINKRMEIKAFEHLNNFVDVQNTEIYGTYTIEYLSKDFISIKYTYYSFYISQAYPYIAMDTLNMRLDEDYIVSLDDLINIDDEFKDNFFENFELENNADYSEFSIDTFNKDTQKYYLNNELDELNNYLYDNWYVEGNDIILIFPNAGGGNDHIYYRSKNINTADLIKNMIN